MTTTIINLKSQRRPRSDSIGPATTPDIQSNLLTIPFQPDLFNVALERNVSIQSIRIKKGKGKEIIIESDEDEDDDDEESEVQEEGVDDEEEESNELDWEMKYLGFSMISFSFLAFTFGVWSIAIGPFLDQTGLLVLDTIAQDKHHKYLLIFIVPITLYAVIINWWGLKIFRHA